MKIKKYCLMICYVSFLFNLQFLQAEEFLYPVASYIKDGQWQVYLLYQKSIKHVELWVWDPTTTLVNKALLSSYTPAGLRILPDQSGFSFIDNGRIKIKQFAKRSPKSLDIYEPIYEIGVLEWIDPVQCYFSAKESEFDKERTSIFHLDMQGELIKIVGSKEADCLYPQKVGNQLFFIERSVHRDFPMCRSEISNRCRLDGCHQNSQFIHFKIRKMQYPAISCCTETFNDTENFDQRVQQLMNKTSTINHFKDLNNETELVLDWQEWGKPDEALAFLHMISDTEGFVIAHPSKIDKQDKTITLSYYQVLLQNKTWQAKQLFTYEVPLDLLLPESASRLYESMLPILPRHYNNDIYYMDCSESKSSTLALYIYHLVCGQKTKLASGHESGQHFFAPIMLGKQLYCGGSILPDTDTPPYMKINDGFMCFELPKL